MYNKLAFKHKNSLVLQPNKSRGDRNETKSFSNDSHPFQFILLPAITCAIFVTYWFIICPLIWSICYPIAHEDHWHDPWPFYFWITALLVWILIMIILICIWKYLKSRYTNARTVKSYGSDDCESPALMTNGKQDMFDSSHPNRKRNMERYPTVIDDTISESHDGEKKRPVDLPPLSIHRHMSGNDIENTGDVTIENPPSKSDEDAHLSKVADDINRRSMKEYLTLVTLTPTKDEEAEKKSPKTPMSPRDLFFIDLIREAEKAESSGKKMTPVERQHFFPDDMPPATPAEDSCETRKKEDKPAKDGEENCRKSEADYFIASINSPSCEKTEVFIEIEPDAAAANKDDHAKQWSVDLNKEKPVLTLETNDASEGNEQKEQNDQSGGNDQNDQNDQNYQNDQSGQNEQNDVADNSDMFEI